MANWPTLEEFAQVVDVTNVADWQETLERTLAAAIAQTKALVGSPDDDVEPDESLAQLALYLGQSFSERPNVPAAELLRDSRVQALIYGHRRRFAIS